MRRHRTRQADARVQDFVVATAAQSAYRRPCHRPARYPSESVSSIEPSRGTGDLKSVAPITMHQRGGGDGLADARIGAGHEDAAEAELGLLEHGGECGDEPIERLLRQSRIHRHSQTSRAARDARGSDGASIEPFLLKSPATADGAIVVADQNRNDLRRSRRNQDPGRRQTVRRCPANAINRSRRSGSSATIDEARLDRIGQRRRRRRRKHERPRALHEVVDRPMTAR